MIIKADIIENAAADHTMLSRSCAHSSDCSKATSAKTFALARCALAVSTVLCGMLATPLLAQAQNLDLATPGMVESGDINPFHFDSNIIDTIQFSRVETTDQTLRYAERQTEFSLSLKPAMPKFSLENGFGLNMFSHAQPAVEIESGRLGRNRLVESIPDLHNGFAYSAGVKVEHEDEDIDERNPWGGHTLEWLTESPPPPGNFDGPYVVTSEAPLLDDDFENPYAEGASA